MMNIMNPPADWSTLKKLIWLRGTPITGGEELTVSGTPPLSLPNSLGKPLKAWSVDVLPYQEGTGDPSPSNVRPIYGTDKLTITTAGKNLFDAGTHLFVTGKYINAANGNEGSGTNTCACLDYIETPPYNFTISCAENANGRIAFYDETQTYISGAYTVVNVTPPNGAKYFRFSFTADTVSNVMMEFGSTATTYTPYLAPSQTAITLPQTVYTGTIGSEGGESRSAKLVLTGTEDFYRNETINGHWRFTLAVPNVEKSLTPNAISNMYKACNPNETYLGVKGVSHNSTSSTLFICDEQFITTEELMTFLAAQYAANTPVYIVYPLETPTTFAVPSSTIPTPTGTATTWATAEDGTVDGMEVTYVGKA